MSAVYRMSGHEQLKTTARQPQSLGAPGIYHHALPDRFGAGGNRPVIALYLDKAQTAGGHRLRLIPHGAQVGDINTIVQGYPEKVRSPAGSYFTAINR